MFKTKWNCLTGNTNVEQQQDSTQSESLDSLKASSIRINQSDSDEPDATMESSPESTENPGNSYLPDKF